MSNVPDHFKHLEALSAADIEREIQKLRAVDPEKMSDDDLERAVALHAIARRKTAGPPKSKAVKSNETVGDLSNILGF